jgi:ubiquinone biosynthesis protein
MAIPRPDIGLKNLIRYRQIAAVLVKYGFGEFVYRMNLMSPFRPGAKKPSEKALGQSTPVRVRLALQELGPSFVKLGQVLSTRPFLLPYDYILELTKLQDQVDPMPWPVAESVLKRELGGTIEDHFTEFDSTAIASASLSEVHRAKLKDGTPVVVKIQREGIRKVIESDVRILKDIAEMLENNVPESQQFEPKRIVEEFARSTFKELNFINEARNTEIFANNFKNEPGVKIPRIFWELTTSKVMTMEEIIGIKISRVDELKSSGCDTNLICQNGSRLFLKMIFEDGFFHADPHPGNLFVCEGGVIAPVDYGMMGTLSETQMDELAEMVMAIMGKDVRGVIRVLQNSGVLPDGCNIRSLEQELSELLVRYSGQELARIDLRSASEEFLSLIHHFQIRFQPEFMLLGKALITYEEVARMLNPGFNFFAELVPYMKKLTTRKYRPGKIARDLMGIFDELRWFLVESPREWRGIATKLRKGDLQIQLQIKGLDVIIRELDRSSNRLSLSLLVAALIVGSSIIATMQKGYTVFDIPLLGLIGYIFAAILGILLVISILRSRKL